MQGCVQVSAVGDTIGRAVAFFEALTEGQNFQDFARHAIAHVYGGWAACHGLDCVPRAQLLQGAYGVGAELQACTNG